MERLQRPLKLKEQVLRLIRKSIIEGELKAGEHLVEAEIARRLGTSRGPVREALSTLEGEGFVSRSDGDLFVTRLTKQDIYEIYTIRSVLEGLAVRLAVSQLTSADFATLDRLLKEILQHSKCLDGTSTVNKSLAIHEFLVQKSGHKRLADLWTNLNLQLHILASVVMTYDSVEDTFQKHSRLLDAIKTLDPDQAENAIKEHIMDSWKIVGERLLSEEQEKPVL